MNNDHENGRKQVLRELRLGEVLKFAEIAEVLKSQVKVNDALSRAGKDLPKRQEQAAKAYCQQQCTPDQESHRITAAKYMKDLKSISMLVNSVLHNKSLQNGALFSLFSFINRGLIFILLFLLANYITPDEYGYLSLFSTIVSLIMYFMAMCTEGYIGISFFEGGKNKLADSFSCIFVTSIIVSSLLLLTLLLFGARLAELLSLPLMVLSSCVVICFFTLYVNLVLDIYRLKRQIVPYGIISCGNALLNFVLSIVFVKTFLWGWEGRVRAQLVCVALFGVFGLVYCLKNRYLKKPDLSYWKMMLVWGIPLIPHNATNFLRQGCDRYIINASHSISDVGLFSFAMNLANVIMMIGVGFNQSNSVEIYKVLGDAGLSKEDKYRRIRSQTRSMFVLYLSLSVLVALAIAVIVPFFLQSYADSIPYFIILAVYGFLTCVYFLYINILFFYKKTKLIMAITFCSAVLHLCLSLMLTRYSLYITCFIYIVTQAIVSLLVRREAVKELRYQLAMPAITF